MMKRQEQNDEEEEDRFKELNELSALVLNIIRSPVDQNRTQITPAGFASFLLGISVSLMLCGSVTFFIGFVLMPWILAFVICLYFVGLVSTVSMIGKALLTWNSPPPSPPTKTAAASKYL